MKKDPLTQTSINSFFSAGAIKREPEENMDTNQDHTESQQNPKRRKIEESTDNVKIKTEPVDEPMETCEAEQPTQQNIIKTEPPEYGSDANTDSESDDDNETPNNAQVEKSRKTHESENGTHAEIPHSIIKHEQDSDNDTDTPSDNDEDTTETTTNNENKSGPIRIKSEPGVSQQSAPPKVPEQTPIAEPMDFQQQIKGEPQDEPNYSDQETDEDGTTSGLITSKFSEHIEQQVAGTSYNTGRTQVQHSDWYQPLPTSNLSPVSSDISYRDTSNQSEHQFKAVDNQQPSTSYHSPASTDFPHKDTSNQSGYQINLVKNQPRPTSNHSPASTDFSYRDTSNQSGHKFNAVEPNPSLRGNTADRNLPLKLSQFTGVVKEAEKNYVEINDDENFALEDLGEVIEKYVNDLEKQNEAELEKLTKIKVEGLNPQQLKEASLRLNQLRKKKEMIMNQKAQEIRKRTEEELEKVRDSFMNGLFGPGFDASDYELRTTDPSTPRGDSASTSKDIKGNVTYNEIINKPKIKPDMGKTAREHYTNVVLNEHIKNMKDQKMLDLVPDKAIETVLDSKTRIKTRVDRYLMPYYNDGVISEKAYSTICGTIVKDCFDMNIYGNVTLDSDISCSFSYSFVLFLFFSLFSDPDLIKEKVEDIMKQIIERRQNSNP